MLHTFTNHAGVPMVARLVLTGLRYGRGDVLTANRPLVEFYDQRYRHTPFGQFIVSYYAETLREREPGRGLLLDSGNPAWSLTADEMDAVRKALL